MLPETLTPANRRLLIFPHFKKKTEDRGFVLPESYEQDQGAYLSATVLSVAEDCSKQFKQLKYSKEVREIIVNRSMIEEVEYRDKTNYMILENYVIAIVDNQFGGHK